MKMSRELINIRKDIRFTFKQLEKIEELTHVQYEFLFYEYRVSQIEHKKITGKFYEEYLIYEEYCV